MNSNPEIKDKNGFSLVEVMVATMVLTIGLLAMAASTGYISAQLRSTTFDTRRNAAKMQVVEQLRATQYTSLPTATTTQTIGDFTVSYSTTFSTNFATVNITTTGPAYRQRAGSMSSVSDQMSITILRPQT